MSSFNWSGLVWSLALLAVPVLSSVLVTLLLDLKKFIQVKVKSAELASILGRLDDAAVTIVQALNQTFVNDTKAAQGGKLNAAQIATLKADSLSDLKSAVSVSELMTVLGLDGGELESFLESKLEAAVAKLNPPSAVAVAPAAAAAPAPSGPIKAAGMAFGGVAAPAT